MVTGSHNPPDYNGLKMVVAGDTLSGDDIQALRARIEGGRLRDGPRRRTARVDIAPAYLDRIVGDVKLARPLKIAVDCGNGVAGAFAPDAVSRAWAATVVPLFCDVDGTFPNHHPDPSQAGEPAGPDRARSAKATANWAWPSTATATAWAWSRATATSSIPTAS